MTGDHQVVPYSGPERRAGASEWAEELAKLESRINDRFSLGSRRMDDMQAELTRNTTVTTEVRDLLLMVRAGLRVLGAMGTVGKWLLGLITGALALWGAVQALLHGKPPHG